MSSRTRFASIGPDQRLSIPSALQARRGIFMGEGRRFGGSRDDQRSAAWHTRRPAFKAGTVRSWSRFHVLIVGMIAVLALGAALSFDAVGTSNARASVEGGSL